MVFTYIAVDKLDKRGLFVWLSLRRRILKEKKLGIDMQPHFSELRDEDPTFFSTDPDPTQLKKKFRLRLRPEIEMKNKMYLYFR